MIRGSFQGGHFTRSLVYRSKHVYTLKLCCIRFVILETPNCEDIMLFVECKGTPYEVRV